jgi:nucleotide-binding universal stress UspA family protein
MKSSPRRIVCATDFSANARGAADVAAAIALRLRANLILVHVAEGADAYPERTPQYRTEIRRATVALHKEVRRLRKTGATVSDLILHGSWPEIAIVDFVAKDPPALVVVSSVSKTTFDRWTIGSVSERVAQQSPVPTLVVRAPERLLGWVQQDWPLNVVVATDFTVTSDAALSWMRELRKIGACALTVAHVRSSTPERHGISFSAAGASTTTSASARHALSRDLHTRVSEVINGSVAVRVKSNRAHPDAALVRVAADANADLIVVGTHQWHGVKRLAHSSVSRAVLRHAPMSVACVPVSLAIAHGLEHRPHIRRVLVATDFSATGDQAIPWAYAAVPAGGVVKLVHVLTPWEVPSPLVPHYDPKRTNRGEYKRMVNEARDKLAALVPWEAAADGIESELEVISDRDPAHAIHAAATRFGADLICLGSRGRSGLSEVLLGSVARAVFAQSSHPVLLARPPAP